jgi:hypothetical protein
MKSPFAELTALRQGKGAEADAAKLQMVAKDKTRRKMEILCGRMAINLARRHASIFALLLYP